MVYFAALYIRLTELKLESLGYLDRKVFRRSAGKKFHFVFFMHRISFEGYAFELFSLMEVRTESI